MVSQTDWRSLRGCWTYHWEQWCTMKGTRDWGRMDKKLARLERPLEPQLRISLHCPGWAIIDKQGVAQES